MVFISAKFYEKIFHEFRVTKDKHVEYISHNFSPSFRSNQKIKKAELLNSAHCLVIVSISAKFHEKYVLNGFWVTMQTQIGMTQEFHYGRVLVFAPCMSTDHSLLLWKDLEWLLGYRVDTITLIKHHGTMKSVTDWWNHATCFICKTNLYKL